MSNSLIDSDDPYCGFLGTTAEVGIDGVARYVDSGLEVCTDDISDPLVLLGLQGYNKRKKSPVRLLVSYFFFGWCDGALGKPWRQGLYYVGCLCLYVPTVMGFGGHLDLDTGGLVFTVMWVAGFCVWLCKLLNIVEGVKVYNIQAAKSCGFTDTEIYTWGLF